MYATLLFADALAYGGNAHAILMDLARRSYSYS